jgi:hypothetical protein
MFARESMMSLPPSPEPSSRPEPPDDDAPAFASERPVRPEPLLRRLSHFLARLPASGYGLIFLASMPLFAALYHYVLPDDFYSNTVVHERHYHEELVRVQGNLQLTLIEEFGATYGTYAVPLEDGRLLCVDRLQILTFSITGPGIATLNLALPTAPATPGTVWCSRESIDRIEVLDAATGFGRSFTPDAFALPDLTASGQPWLALVFTSTESQDAAGRLLPPVPSGEVIDLSEDRLLFAIAISDHLERQVRELFEAHQGNPSGLPGGYWRMLYMSAIATTTTGFGDIVPITTRARIITIGEVFLGMILVGLFLNALTVRRGVG